MFTQIKINKFRAINDKTFRLGKYVTMFAGWNGTGKSTVLALMANSTELKKEQGLTYTGKQFRAEFSEILKGSEKFDITEPNRLEVSYTDNSGKERIKTFRTTWQKGGRYRVIPREIPKERGQKPNEAKFEVPVIYLGLSRLYPIGELKNRSISDKDLSFEEYKDDEQWFKDKHIEILSSNREVRIQGVSNLDIKSTYKTKIGVKTDKYDWKTNSSGQDNLGQILLSILSFKKLKREMKNDYKGGLLIIDELEASLHPKAQEKLLKLLVEEARENNIQVLFTTHSLTLIKRFLEKNKNRNQNLKHYYFTNSNSRLEIHEDYDYKNIEEDLLVSLYSRNNREIVVYTEDKEARWFLKKLIEQNEEKLGYLKYRDVCIGCQALIDLMNCEPVFEDYLVVFDGDLKEQDINRIKKCKNNCITLPTYPGESYSPEKLLYDFIFSDAAKEYFTEENKKNTKVKIEYFREHGLQIENNLKEREKYKKWFEQHQNLFEDSNIFEYWKKENDHLVKEFLQNFKKAYNTIAKKKGIEELTG